jgi:predicted ribosomally synthesized peptide with nif11-like leader
MSRENVLAFIEHTKTDKDLNLEIRKLLALGDNNLGFVRVAEAHGFDFTVEEWMETVMNMYGRPTQELNIQDFDFDKELD